MTDQLILPDELIHMISHGDFDGNLDRIRDAIKRRQMSVDNSAAWQLKPGDQFYIKDVKPLYLSGALVEFVEYVGGAAPLRCKLVFNVRQNYYAGRTLNLRECHIGKTRPGRI